MGILPYYHARALFLSVFQEVDFKSHRSYDDDQLAGLRKALPGLKSALAVNYRPKRPLENIPAPGRGIAASIKSQLWNMMMGKFITEYELEMGALIAQVICGGDVAAGTLVSEEYLLQLEREGFLKLCTNKKTVERIQHMLKRGKALRN